MAKVDIVIGEKADIRYGKSPYYRTVVESVDDDGSLVVELPTYKGTPAPFRVNQELEMMLYRENGKYSVDVRVLRLREIDNIKLVDIEIISEFRKEQRRGYYRLPVVLRAEVSKLPVSLPTELHRLPEAIPQMDDVMTYEEAVDTLDDYTTQREASTTKDISISGLSVRAKSEYQIGESLIVKVHLDSAGKGEQSINAMVQVRRVLYDDVSGTYLLGLEFVGAFAKRDEITRFIFEQQQKRIRQQKLVKDK
jgi:c-di-GMP-binding flagellar brake protein YcgR